MHISSSGICIFKFKKKKRGVRLKKIICLIMSVLLTIQLNNIASANEVKTFSDVPTGHWAEENINTLRRLKVTDGIGENQYGLGDTLSRAQFVAFLYKLQDWQETSSRQGSFTDIHPSDWYYASIETALEKGVITRDDQTFRPNEPITREEMALMIVRTLGYGWMAERMNDQRSPFTDVTKNIGFITMLKDFGIINGVGDGRFAPDAWATREEAAAILVRMYEKTHNDLDETNVFYRDSSYGQIDLMQDFDVVSFGWADLKVDGNQTIVVENKFPLGYEEPLQKADRENAEVRLSIYADNQENLLSNLLASNEEQAQIITSIMNMLDTHSAFDGIVIDFEGLRGSQNRSAFIRFLKELDQELSRRSKTLTVMVQPQVYYDGYDYGTINTIADHTIMMAHDFGAKRLTEAEMDMGITTTPLTPLEEVYNALKHLTENQNNEEALNKLSLQISFDVAQWQTNSEGQVVNQSAYSPTYATLYNRLIDGGTNIAFGATSRNPYASYYNSQTGLNNVIWYEDSRSVAEKIQLAKMFGIYDISVWRLGNIPNYKDSGDKKVYMELMREFE